MTDSLTYKATDVPTGKVSPDYIQQENQKLANLFRKTKARLEALEANAGVSVTSAVLGTASNMSGTEAAWNTALAITCSVGYWLVNARIHMKNDATWATGTLGGRLRQATDTILVAGFKYMDDTPLADQGFALSTAVNVTATATFYLDGYHSAGFTKTYAMSSAQYSGAPVTAISAVKLA
jgi:hypothetical protein